MEKRDSIGLFVQAVLLVVLAILSIMTIYIEQLVHLVELVLGLVLIATGINNHYVYKRKILTAVYILCGVLVIAFTLYSMVFNGI